MNKFQFTLVEPPLFDLKLFVPRPVKKFPIEKLLNYFSEEKKITGK
jgi:hypothetical protein